MLLNDTSSTFLRQRAADLQPKHARVAAAEQAARDTRLRLEGQLELIDELLGARTADVVDHGAAFVAVADAIAAAAAAERLLWTSVGEAAALKANGARPRRAKRATT